MKGKHLFRNIDEVCRWKGGRSSLDRDAYSIELRQMTANLLTPAPGKRPSAAQVVTECNKML